LASLQLSRCGSWPAFSLDSVATSIGVIRNNQYTASLSILTLKLWSNGSLYARWRETLDSLILCFSLSISSHPVSLLRSHYAIKHTVRSVLTAVLGKFNFLSVLWLLYTKNNELSFNRGWVQYSVSEEKCQKNIWHSARCLTRALTISVHGITYHHTLENNSAPMCHGLRSQNFAC
jgi:hypothetical protein